MEELQHEQRARGRRFCVLEQVRCSTATRGAARCSASSTCAARTRPSPRSAACWWVWGRAGSGGERPTRASREVGGCMCGWRVRVWRVVACAQWALPCVRFAVWCVLTSSQTLFILSENREPMHREPMRAFTCCASRLARSNSCLPTNAVPRDARHAMLHTGGRRRGPGW